MVDEVVLGPAISGGRGAVRGQRQNQLGSEVGDDAACAEGEVLRGERADQLAVSGAASAWAPGALVRAMVAAVAKDMRAASVRLLRTCMKIPSWEVRFVSPSREAA